VLGYEYHPDAEAEYHAAIRTYGRISVELGVSFVSEVEKTVERVRLFPEIHRKIAGNLRRVLTQRFSYSLLYEVLEDRIGCPASIASSTRGPGFGAG